MQIVGFKESSLNEWDGKVASIIWTPGCNWRCAYCHAGHLINDVEKLQIIDKDVVFDYIISKNGWIDGLCISGGEPTLQPDLFEFIEEATTKLDIEIKLATNGSNPAIIEKLLNNNLLGCLCLDFKHMPDHRLLALNGQSGKLYDILQSMNLAFRASKNIEVEFHTTLCPTFIGIDDIKTMGELLHNTGMWILQQYDPTDVIEPEMAREAKYDQEKLDEIYELAKTLHFNVVIKNID